MTTQQITLKQRLSPFLVLLEARYFPLILLALPQAAVVLQWQMLGRNSDNGFIFGLYIIVATLAALAFEAGYVGSIAWGESSGRNAWMWVTSLAALIFSVGVDFRVYWDIEGGWCFLRAGFPLVAFFYTMVIHKSRPLELLPFASEQEQEQQNPPSEKAQERRNDAHPVEVTEQTAQSFSEVAQVLHELPEPTRLIRNEFSGMTSEEVLILAAQELPQDKLKKLRAFATTELKIPTSTFDSRVRRGREARARNAA